MSPTQRKIQQRWIREAEGYLELASACGEQFTLAAAARHRLARRCLQVLAKMEPAAGRQVHVAYLQGQAYSCLEQYHEAIEHLRQAAENDGQNTHIWLALGWCYKRVGRLDLAIESLERAMEVDAGQSIVYYNLACYWSLASNAQLALAYLTRAFDLDPSFRDLVSQEADFDPIRNDPRFLELTSVIV